MTCFTVPEFDMPSAIQLITGDVPGPMISIPFDTTCDSTGFVRYKYHPLLSKDQEYFLFRKYNYWKFTQNETERVATRNQLLDCNFRLAMSLCRDHRVQYVPFDDCLQECIIALMRCVDRFDYRRGFRFVTYAYQVLVFKLRSVARTQAVYNSRFVALDDLEADFQDHRSESVDNVVGDRMRGEAIKAIVDELPPGRAEMLRQRFWEDRTLPDIGESRGVSRQAVSARLRKTLAYLNHSHPELATMWKD